MSNNIQQVQSDLTRVLDAVYKASSFTARLDLASTLVQQIQNMPGTVRVPKIAFDGGLSDYDRVGGYDEAGALTLEWEALKLTKDRTKTFNLDTVDNLQSAGILLANMSSEYLRQHVVPEIDAYRFAKYAGAAETSEEGSLTIDDVEEVVDAAIVHMFETEVPLERLEIFMSGSVYSLLRRSVRNRRVIDNFAYDINSKVLTYDDVPVHPIPATRFNSEVTLKAKLGFDLTGQPINFLLMDKNVPIQVTQHVSNKLIAPEVNQNADGWSWHYRIFHDTFVLDNKRKGIYVHKGAAASGASTTGEEPEEKAA